MVFENQPFVDALRSVFLNNSQNSQESNCVGASVLEELRSSRSRMFFKIGALEDFASVSESSSPMQMFSTVCNFQSTKIPMELNSLLSKFFCYTT